MSLNHKGHHGKLGVPIETPDDREIFLGYKIEDGGSEPIEAWLVPAANTYAWEDNPRVIAKYANTLIDLLHVRWASQHKKPSFITQKGKMVTDAIEAWLKANKVKPVKAKEKPVTEPVAEPILEPVIEPEPVSIPTMNELLALDKTELTVKAIKLGAEFSASMNTEELILSIMQKDPDPYGGTESSGLTITSEGLEPDGTASVDPNDGWSGDPLDNSKSQQ